MIKAAILVIIVNINGSFHEFQDVYLGWEDCVTRGTELAANRMVVRAYCVETSVPNSAINAKYGFEF